MVVTFKKIGTVTITANQPGDSTFSAAPPVNQPMTISTSAVVVTAVQEEPNASNGGIWLYPNPAKEKVKLLLGSEPGTKQITITEIRGSVVLQLSTSLNEVELDITEFNAGLYLVTISDHQEARTLKLIIL